MAYLDNSEITVDAILTTKGREKLAQGQLLGITKFALGDDEIDYTLYEPAHPLGSAYYDSIIRALPITEAIPNEVNALKYKLVTLPAGTTKIVPVSLGITAIETTQKATGLTITPSPANSIYGYTAILADTTAGMIKASSSPSTSVDTSLYISSTILSSKTAQVIVGTSFYFTPNSKLTDDVYTTLTVYSNETGGSVTIPITVLWDSTI